MTNRAQPPPPPGVRQAQPGSGFDAQQPGYLHPHHPAQYKTVAHQEERYYDQQQQDQDSTPPPHPQSRQGGYQQLRPGVAGGRGSDVEAYGQGWGSDVAKLQQQDSRGRVYMPIDQHVQQGSRGRAMDQREQQGSRGRAYAAMGQQEQREQEDVYGQQRAGGRTMVDGGYSQAYDSEVAAGWQHQGGFAGAEAGVYVQPGWGGAEGQAKASPGPPPPPRPPPPSLSPSLAWRGEEPHGGLSGAMGGGGAPGGLQGGPLRASWGSGGGGGGMPAILDAIKEGSYHLRRPSQSARLRQSHSVGPEAKLRQSESLALSPSSQQLLIERARQMRCMMSPVDGDSDEEAYW